MKLGGQARAARSRLSVIAALLCALVDGSNSPAAAATFDTQIVTASKLPSDAATLTAMRSTVSGAELRARGARDLRSALALVAGVEISPAGDGGPASAVPSLWGLREIDAFLLVVDGVPYGGAFNPALATLDLTDVERIEVIRGPAPVSYGATSFVGIIHVIHAAPGATAARLTLSTGTRGERVAAFAGTLPGTTRFRHSVVLNGEERRFNHHDASVGKAHLLYRAALDVDRDTLQADVDFTHLRQNPYSPHPRDGTHLSKRFARDANVNPRDARQDQDRVQLKLRHSRDFGASRFATTLSVAHTASAATRGFLREGFASDGITPNADGYRQHQHVTDLWLDSGWSGRLGRQWQWAAGLDWIYGDGGQHSANFEYSVLPSGRYRPASRALPIDEVTRLDVERSFLGLYVQADWQATVRWKWSAGLRLNRTDESRAGTLITAGASSDDQQQRIKTRPSGSVGSSYLLYADDSAYLTAYADWRSTFKPAAADLGPEAEADILKPESASSYEVGLRGRAFATRLQWELSGFHMDFRNLVIRENVGGLPALANAGRERLRGAELEFAWHFTTTLQLAGSGAYHDSRYVDYARLRPDGSVQQLKGRALELAPQAQGALGLVLAPPQGVLASVIARYSGRRYLNKSNTAVAPGYVSFDAGLGYRWPHFEMRVDGSNLSNRRDAVAESELGDAQFYRLSGRLIMASLSWEM